MGDLLQRHVANLRQLLGGMSDEERLIAAGMNWFGDQVGAIRLDQDAIEGGHTRHLWQRVALFRQWSGEREHKSGEGQTFLSLRDIAGEAMEDAVQTLPMSAQQLDHIVVRVAHMDDAGQVALASELKMSAEN